jgi:thiol-activated cytolysin
LVQIKGSFDWSAQTKKSRYLVTFVQSYYTVDVDAPARASDVFAPEVTRDEVAAVTGAGNPPVYVSSITYGRTVIFSFESDADETELGAALEAVYKGPGAASGMISTTTRNVLAQSRMSAYVLGGSGQDAAAAIDNADALLALIRSGGNYSLESPGAPIAYKLAHLADNVPARLSFTTDYSVKTCSPTTGQLRVTLEAFTLDGSAQELDGNIELFGNVTVSTFGGAPASLFSRSRTSPLVIDADETVPPTGTLGDQTLVISTTGNMAPITIRADLWDADAGNGIDPDDDLGYTTFTLDLAGGWTRSFDVTSSGTGARVLLRVSTRPL